MDNTILIEANGLELTLKVEPGVFSKSGLDDGTKILLKHIKVEDRQVVADLGSGTGVVGFIAAKSNRRAHVHLLDDHLRSINLAKQNAELNNLGNVEIYLSDLFSAIGERSYHQIFTNPPQQLGNQFLEELINECFKHVKEEGRVLMVVKRNLKNVVERMLEKKFKAVDIIDQGREHILFEAKKS